MNGHRDADADAESVGDRHIPQPPLFRKEPEERDGHGERDGSDFEDQPFENRIRRCEMLYGLLHHGRIGEVGKSFGLPKDASCRKIKSLV